MTNCVLIGLNAGLHLTDNSEGVVIIGDDVLSLDKSQPNVLFLGDKVAIGTVLNGFPINLKEVIENFVHNSSNTIK
jgi:hypothetical protein